MSLLDVYRQVNEEYGFDVLAKYYSYEEASEWASSQGIKRGKAW